MGQNKLYSLGEIESLFMMIQEKGNGELVTSILENTPEYNNIIILHILRGGIKFLS